MTKLKLTYPYAIAYIDIIPDVLKKIKGFP